jgi:hypothetical protein
MGAPKILFMDLLRIITPEEISELTTKHEGEIRHTLSEYLLAEVEGRTFVMDSGKATDKKKGDNVLPFPGQEQALESSDEAPLEVQEAVEVVVEAEAVNLAVDTTSSFILSEKKRFEKNQRHLKSIEVMNLYSQGASQTGRLKKKDTDLNHNIDVGALINKKHY